MLPVVVGGAGRRITVLQYFKKRIKERGREEGRREKKEVRILHYFLEKSHNHCQFGRVSLYSVPFTNVMALTTSGKEVQ